MVFFYYEIFYLYVFSNSLFFIQQIFPLTLSTFSLSSLSSSQIDKIFTYFEILQVKNYIYIYNCFFLIFNLLKLLMSICWSYFINVEKYLDKRLKNFQVWVTYLLCFHYIYIYIYIYIFNMLVMYRKIVIKEQEIKELFEWICY